MNTVTEIVVSVPRSVNVKAVWRSVDSLLSDHERRFSVAGEASEVRVLNERESQTMAVSTELGEMLKTGLVWGDSLDGAFDITVLPLKEIWGFCEECTGEEPLPDSNQIDAAIKKINYQNIQMNDACDSVHFKTPDTRVDVGGIAKGYALRRMMTLLRDRGINNFLISAGGDVAASGTKDDGTPWRVGVRHPRDASGLITAIPMTRGTIVTSGDYERFRMVAGIRYHHIFDPETGYSCGRNQSLTILADDPITADILSTGLFCRSAEEILAYVQARDGIECVVVDSSGTVFSSEHF